MKNFKEKWKSFIIYFYDFFRLLFYGMIIFVIVFSTLLANSVVPSSSMEPTIDVGDRLIVSRVAYNDTTRTPQREDIIVFRYPDNNRQIFIKRCMGLPGEVVSIREGKLHINGDIVEEPFIKEKYNMETDDTYIPKAGDEVEIKDNYCYINGYFVGFVDPHKVKTNKTEIPDKGFVEMYCTEEDGKITVSKNCYLMLGDNVNNSADSRYWFNKYINDDLIIGKAEFKVFSKSFNYKLY